MSHICTAISRTSRHSFWLGRQAIQKCLTLLTVLALSLPANAQGKMDGGVFYEGLSIFVSATAEGVSQFGEASGTLVDLRRGSFAGVGTGRTQRDLARSWNTTLGRYRQAMQGTKNSLPFKIAPWAVMAVEASTSVIAPLLDGDMKGASAGAVNLVGSTAASSGGASLFGTIGSGTGAAIGSFFPVIGTAAGSMVGGAVGSIAGGFISAAGYDIYVKQNVGDLVEGAIATVFDPRTAAIRSRELYLRTKAGLALKPYWDSLHQISEGFDLNGVELLNLPMVPYSSSTPQDLAATPATAQAPVVLVTIPTRFETDAGSGTWELTDGSTGTWSKDDVGSDGVDKCTRLVIRDGYFFLRCDQTADHTFEYGKIHIDSEFTLMGVIQDVSLTGWFQTWARSYDVGATDRDNGEYMRSYSGGVVNGTINMDGTVSVVMQFQRDQVYDMASERRDMHLVKLGYWKTRDMSLQASSFLVAARHNIVATEEEGNLSHPEITAEFIRGQIENGFEIPSVFFQHGASPPPY